jgi:hypothetical protein
MKLAGLDVNHQAVGIAEPEHPVAACPETPKPRLNDALEVLQLSHRGSFGFDAEAT